MRMHLVPEHEGRLIANNFDLIRIGMAILVVWSHAYALYLGSESTEPLSRLTNGTINSGNLGVYVFFMVSGFLITQSFDRSSSPWSFLKKRLLRIYPGYLVAVAICAFLIIPACASVTYTVQTVAKTIGLNLLLQGWFVVHPFSHNPESAVNGSLWSIPYEFWCYLGVLALGLTGLLGIQRRHWLLIVFAATLLVRAWLEVTGRKPGGGLIGAIIGWPYQWFKMLPCFLGGMLVHRYRDVVPRRLWIALGGVLAVASLSWLPIHEAWKTALVGIAFPPAVTYCVFYFAFARQFLNAGKYGDFSYGTYLYAFPIEQILRATYGNNIPFYIYVQLSILLSICAGIVSWYCVERWFTLKKTETKGRVLREAIVKS